MRRIIQRQITTIQIVSVQLTWSDEDEPQGTESAPASEELALPENGGIVKPRSARQKRSRQGPRSKSSKQTENENL